MKTADVVIVGAGVVGASVAHHLAARGCGSVVVLERAGELGAGSTGKATGGFRAQFATEVNVRLSLLAREKLLRFTDEVGADPGYRQSGYLFVAHDPDDLEALRAALRVQHAAGLPEAGEVSTDDVADINPAVRLDGVVGGAFCPTDGFIRPLQILKGYAASARRLGVSLVFGVEDVAFETDRLGRIGWVRTPAEAFAAGCVVNAAGAWAAELARKAGLEVPVEPLRRQVAPTRPCDALPESMPMTIFLEDGFHLRVRDGRVLLLWPDENASRGSFDTSFDAAWIDGVVARARARVPCLESVEVDREACWAGLYEMSPDRHALLGLAPGAENFYVAAGSSGHGVMHAPALGQLLAEMILDGAASAIDTRALRPSRFTEGAPNAASDLL